VGFKLSGRLRDGVTATDLVLTVTQMLRKKGVVDKFVEFYGPGLSAMTLPDRATIANMAPEYGATMGFFPVDAETLRYLERTARPDAAKLSPYECGFEAFEDARMKFDVRYYLIAILFILFDLEIAFLFPWAVVLPDIGIFGFWSMMVFLAILVIGFIYEWKKGALEWE